VAVFLEEEREALAQALGLAGVERIAISGDETLGYERFEVETA
jgi:hypothetical protein